jgi:4-hydroxy-tetrahydrodipicolinate synthase
MVMKPSELRESLRGAVVIAITPFNADYSLDERGLSSNLEFLVEHGIRGGIVVGGSLGECYAMTTPERKRTFELAVEAVSGRAPLLCGVNHSSTLEAVALARHAQEVGADGVMLLPPYYMAPNDASILLHYQMVSEAIDLGILVYNNQWVSKVDLSLAMLKKLTAFENVVAVKDCTPDFFRFRQAIDHLGDRLSILNCTAEYWEPYASAAGSRGFLTAMANFAPEISIELAEASQSGELDRARQVYRRRVHPYLEVEHTVMRDLGDAETIALYKVAMKLRGLAGGPVRPPLHPLPESYLKPLQAALEKVGAL